MSCPCVSIETLPTCKRWEASEKFEAKERSPSPKRMRGPDPLTTADLRAAEDEAHALYLSPVTEDEDDVSELSAVTEDENPPPDGDSDEDGVPDLRPSPMLPVAADESDSDDASDLSSPSPLLPVAAEESDEDASDLSSVSSPSLDPRSPLDPNTAAYLRPLETLNDFILASHRRLDLLRQPGPASVEERRRRTMFAMELIAGQSAWDLPSHDVDAVFSAMVDALPLI